MAEDLVTLDSLAGFEDKLWEYVVDDLYPNQLGYQYGSCGTIGSTNSGQTLAVGGEVYIDDDTTVQYPPDGSLIITKEKAMTLPESVLPLAIIASDTSGAVFTAVETVQIAYLYMSSFVYKGATKGISAGVTFTASLAIVESYDWG